MDRLEELKRYADELSGDIAKRFGFDKLSPEVKLLEQYPDRDDQEYENWGGFCSPYENIIYLPEIIESEGQNNPAHELGHVYHDANNNSDILHKPPELAFSDEAFRDPDILIEEFKGTCYHHLIRRTAIQSVGYAMGARYFSGKVPFYPINIVIAVCMRREDFCPKDDNDMARVESNLFKAIKSIWSAGDDLGEMFGSYIVRKYSNPDPKILEMIRANPADLAEAAFKLNTGIPIGDGEPLPAGLIQVI